MLEIIGSYYLWVKALHVIAVIAWMAGLLYLPRLFVYHTQTANGSDQDQTFQTMERRLYKFIMNPAMMVAWTLALLMLAANSDLMRQGWMHGKLLLVVLLTASHIYMGSCVRTFAKGANTRSDRFYRILNEVPTILMIGIVLLAVAKPF